MHLGNYLGAVRHWVKMQEDDTFECMYPIVDLHAITASYETETLAQATRELAAALIAAGIDTKKSVIFVQSSVHAHAELMWLLASITRIRSRRPMSA